MVLDKELCWCGACSAETGNVACRKKKEAANFRVQPPSLRRDDRSGRRVATGLGFKDEGGKLWKYLVGQNGRQVWNSGEDELFCMTYWQLDEVWTTPGKSYLRQKKPKNRKTSRTLSKPGKTLNQDSRNALETNQDTCSSPLNVHNSFLQGHDVKPCGWPSHQVFSCWLQGSERDHTGSFGRCSSPPLCLGRGSLSSRRLSGGSDSTAWQNSELCGAARVRRETGARVHGKHPRGPNRPSGHISRVLQFRHPKSRSSPGWEASWPWICPHPLSDAEFVFPLVNQLFS